MLVRQKAPLSASFRHASLSREIALRIFGKRDGQAGLPLIVYFHGGFFDSGSTVDADGIADALAENAVVVTVDYPPAPEVLFPDTAEIAFAALQWAQAHAAALGADDQRLFVAGDQAGGNLAAAVAMIARDRITPTSRGICLKGQILITPMLDPNQTTSSMKSSEKCICREGWSAYLPTISDAMHPYAAPGQSRRLGGLASALIVSADSDAMRDEAEQYATHLIAAGVPVQMRRLDGSPCNLVQVRHPDFSLLVSIVTQFINDPG